MIKEFPDQSIYADDIFYVPFVDLKDGRVGYRIVGQGPGGEEEFLYFNPSDGSDDRNVFVYQGGENDPAFDGPVNFYEVAEEWTKVGDHE